MPHNETFSGEDSTSTTTNNRDDIDEYAQSRNTSHQRLHRDRESEAGILGEMLTTNGNLDQQMTPTEPIPDIPDEDMSHFNIGYWDGLGAHRMPNTKDRREVEE